MADGRKPGLRTSRLALLLVLLLTGILPDCGPDLRREALYADPAGRYALYVGATGQGLWCIPSSGPPVQWLQDGYNSIYIP